MTTHDPDVAAVVAEGVINYYDEKHGSDAFHAANRAAVAAQLAALTAAGYVVVRVPEGVMVEHGARLVEGWEAHNWYGPDLYSIEPPSEAP